MATNSQWFVPSPHVREIAKQLEEAMRPSQEVRRYLEEMNHGVEKAKQVILANFQPSTTKANTDGDKSEKKALTEKGAANDKAPKGKKDKTGDPF